MNCLVYCSSVPMTRYSRTCLGRPPLWPSKCGLSRQVQLHWNIEPFARIIWPFNMFKTLISHSNGLSRQISLYELRLQPGKVIISCIRFQAWSGGVHINNLSLSCLYRYFKSWMCMVILNLRERQEKKMNHHILSHSNMCKPCTWCTMNIIMNIDIAVSSSLSF